MPAGPHKHDMETLREALARLERRGYRRSFRPGRDGMLEIDGAPPQAPETLTIDDVARYEGESDPEDQAILFALRSADGRIRGTFVTSYGTHLDPDSVAAIRRLDRASARQRAARGAASRPEPSAACITDTQEERTR